MTSLSKKPETGGVQSRYIAERRAISPPTHTAGMGTPSEVSMSTGPEAISGLMLLDLSSGTT